MFLVKSCSQRYNISNSRTIKIGTLHEYRETESLQILDKEEGFFDIVFDLKNKYIETDLFNCLNNSHNSHLSAYVENLSFKDNYQNYIRVDYQGKYSWINYNRFIFCISKLGSHEESTTIFPDYDDYWYISFFKKQQLIKSLEIALFNDVKNRINNGEKVFTKEDVNVDKLTIKSHSQDIIYSNRSLYLDNHNMDSMKDKIMDIFRDIKYLKPDGFKKESEFRIVFDFYDENQLLIPAVKSLIIKENILEIIKLPNEIKIA
jgi:archaellin